MVLPFELVVLKALSHEQDAFKGENFFACVTKIVTTNLDFVFKLGSIFCMEWSLRVQKLKQDDTNGPDVSLVRIMRLLHNLGSHVKRCSTNSFIDLVQPFQFF